MSGITQSANVTTVVASIRSGLRFFKAQRHLAASLSQRMVLARKVAPPLVNYAAVRRSGDVPRSGLLGPADLLLLC
jgi:hypothetical protein